LTLIHADHGDLLDMSINDGPELDKRGTNRSGCLDREGTKGGADASAKNAKQTVIAEQGQDAIAQRRQNLCQLDQKGRLEWFHRTRISFVIANNRFYPMEQLFLAVS
jgi:hypothetical protein